MTTEATPRTQVRCKHCGSYDQPEADEPQDVCVDCGTTRSAVVEMLFDVQGTTSSGMADLRERTADRIMRLFLSGGGR